MKIQHLIEKRRNPKINRKISAVEVLGQYKHDSDVYISFVADVGRISTPSAIHIPGVSPIEYPGRNVSGTKIGVNPRSVFAMTPGGIYVYPLREIWDDLVDGTIPFAGMQPFIYVLKATGSILDLGDYTKSDFDRDMNKITPIIWRLIDKQEDLEGFEPEDLIEEWAYYSRLQTPGGEFWTVTNRLAVELANERKQQSKKISLSTPWIWNSILRSLGYNGIVDRGSGIIHDKEPIQGVFLKRDAFRVITVLKNDTPNHPSQFNKS